jgi:hypothetical protein
VIAMSKRFHTDVDAASIQTTFLELVKCQRAHATAEARWREQGPRLLRGKAAVLWRRTEELSRRRRELGRLLRKKAKAYAPRLNGGA